MKKEKRDQVIKIRVTKSEKEILQNAADQKGIPLSVYIRQAALHSGSTDELDALQNKTMAYNMMQDTLQTYSGYPGLASALTSLYEVVKKL